MRKKIRSLIERVFPSLFGSEELFSIEKDPAQMDGDEWFAAFAAKNEADESGSKAALCPWPGCEGHMLEGPSGGAAVNIKCDTCERKWNFMGPIGRMDRIE